MTMSDYQYPAQLPVTTTGGWARPGWWDVVADGEKAGRFGSADRQELLDDYCQLAIYDQESAGLDILTDGEHRRGGWIEGITGKMAGLALKPAPRRLGAIGWDQLPVYEVREPLDQVESIWDYTAEYEFLRARTGPAAKRLLAMWPTSTAGTNAYSSNVVTHCTAEQSWLANGGAIYGGAYNRIEDCQFFDTTYNCGVLISTTFPVGGNTFEEPRWSSVVTWFVAGVTIPADTDGAASCFRRAISPVIGSMLTTSSDQNFCPASSNLPALQSRVNVFATSCVSMIGLLTELRT